MLFKKARWSLRTPTKGRAFWSREVSNHFESEKHKTKIPSNFADFLTVKSLHFGESLQNKGTVLHLTG